MKANKASKQTGSKRLRYCILCNSAWEVDATLSIEVKYADFPSIGLERQYCATCKQTSPEANIPSTSAQKLATKHQKLFISHVKKQSN